MEVVCGKKGKILVIVTALQVIPTVNKKHDWGCLEENFVRN